MTIRTRTIYVGPYIILPQVECWHQVINPLPFFSSHGLLPLIPSHKRPPYLASLPTNPPAQYQRRHTLPERFLINALYA